MFALAFGCIGFHTPAGDLPFVICLRNTTHNTCTAPLQAKKFRSPPGEFFKKTLKIKKEFTPGASGRMATSGMRIACEFFMVRCACSACLYLPHKFKFVVFVLTNLNFRAQPCADVLIRIQIIGVILCG